ncbi:hypothetical protein OZ411_36370 [Bradyrhizobium sp. Arg237L]|uniref:hypothetical protein n=1 Tax=Bradyrhizobium sp. Arg237L TaxID=3003352 RepID=UPI00249E9B49|nr:hypothetical protein [Bradyrhizobium sp. Arg237L]MDI4238290.1 hypothetical protein [Bradyrhizobium sp. Arg237L]
MTFSRRGLTGRADGDQSFPIDSWGLDDMIVQQATAALGKRFQVQPVTYNRSAFAKLETESIVTHVNLVRSDPIKKLVRAEVSPQGLDAYVVITKAKASSSGSGRKIEGVGFITYGTVMAPYSRIHALYEVRVIDGKTFDIIEKRTADPLGNLEELRLQGPSRPIDDSYSPSKGDPVGNENLRQAISSLISESLSSTLGDMHLADAP